MSHRLLWLVVAATCLAAVINLHPYPLYLGTSLVFGMSVAFATLFLTKGWWGFVVAVSASATTMHMWGQPYSGLIFLLEAVVLTLLINDPKGTLLLRKGHIITVDFAFWIAIGGPLYYLVHHFLLGLGHTESMAIAEKSAVNGVINVLIAYCFYAIITLFRNKRSEARPSISIRGISLALIYGIIVLSTMFTAGRIYNNYVNILANSIGDQFESRSKYAIEVLNANSSTEEKDDILDYMARGDASFRWLDSRFGLFSLSSSDNVLKEGLQGFMIVTDKTEISRIAANTVKLPDVLHLLISSEDANLPLLTQLKVSTWYSKIVEGDESVEMMRKAEADFDQLIVFYQKILRTLVYGLSLGMVVSVIASLIIEREFRSVLRCSDNVRTSDLRDNSYLLSLSPIQEISSLAIKVNERTSIIQADKHKIEELNKIAQQQLSTAGEIQQCFLGSRGNTNSYPDISLFMRPAYNAGGDWYDVFDIEGKTFLVVADVCDKGVGAALFMSVFRSLIRYSAESLCSQETNDVEPLDKVLASVNNYMSTEHSDMSMFATVFLACINHSKYRLDYVLAGHEEPILLGANGNLYGFEVSGPAIGLFPFAAYKVVTTDYEPGSILVGYSDGVVDARDSNDQSYGHERLIQLIKNLKACNSDLVASDITNALVRELDQHIGNAEQFDDITIAAAIL